MCCVQLADSTLTGDLLTRESRPYPGGARGGPGSGAAPRGYIEISFPDVPTLEDAGVISERRRIVLGSHGRVDN